MRAICDLNDLPDDDAIDIREVIMMMVDSVEPNLRLTTGSQCVLGKSFVDEQGQITRTEPLCQDDRDKLDPLLDSLPKLRADDLSSAGARTFLRQYRDLPDRPVWEPILATYDDILANDRSRGHRKRMLMEDFAEEIRTGQIVAFNDIPTRVHTYTPLDVALIKVSDAKKFVLNRGRKTALMGTGLLLGSQNTVAKAAVETTSAHDPGVASQTSDAPDSPSPNKPAQRGPSGGYPDSVRKTAVEACSRGVSRTEAAREAGVSIQTVSRWVKAHEEAERARNAMEQAQNRSSSLASLTTIVTNGKRT